MKHAMKGHVSITQWLCVLLSVLQLFFNAALFASFDLSKIARVASDQMKSAAEVMKKGIIDLSQLKDLGVAPQGDETVTYGSIVRLVHMNTRKALTVGSKNYTHPGSSGQRMVFGAPVADDATQYWIIKGPHTADRWNAQLGRPVVRGALIRLENVATGYNLHSNRYPSPATGKYKKGGLLLGSLSFYEQQEITVFGNDGIGDSSDNFILDEFVSKDGGGSRGVLSHRSVVKFVHEKTERRLHSHPDQFDLSGDKYQEITGVGRRDDNDWWIVQLIKTPAEHDLSKQRWTEQRGGTLNYNTLITIDPLNTGYDKDREYGSREFGDPFKNNRRLWTHGNSRLVKKDTLEPNRHVELLAGPWKDGRAQQAASWFLIQNADDSAKTGPVNYGDSIKIMACFAAPGEKAMSGPLDPLKIWWVNGNSRYGNGFCEIVISHPDCSETKGDKAIFKLGSVMPRLTSGPVYQNDVIYLHNKAFKEGVLWLHSDSRFGDRYGEILVNNGDDAWGVKHYKNSRDNVFHRFYLRHVDKALVPEKSRQDFATITASLIAKGAMQQDEIAKAARAQAEAASAEAKKLEDAAKQELTRVAEEKAKNEADALKNQVELDKIKKELAVQESGKADLEKMKNEAAAKLAETMAKAEAEKKRIQDDLEAAQKALEDARIQAQARQAAEAAVQKVKFDEKAAETQQKEDEAVAVAQELERLADLPAGFMEVVGKVKALAGSFIRLERNKDHKRSSQERIFQAWAVTSDGLLVQWRDGVNPWVVYPTQSDKGVALKKIKTVAMGKRVVYIIDEDGKAYRFNYPDDKPTRSPLVNAEERARLRKEARERFFQKRKEKRVEKQAGRQEKKTQKKVEKAKRKQEKLEKALEKKEEEKKSE